ncbi:MAG: MmcQ/YjbR family DNA-binding protein [Fimbriimonadaceae bacterium]|nr:MmcQ/YjbR family DNA-binding protein [Fimbriimonadaceae bacterium]
MTWGGKLRQTAESMPHATETWQWDCWVYKVGGKIFAIVDEGDGSVSVKSTVDRQEVLIQDPAISPAPYLARGGWVMVTVGDDDTLTLALELMQESHRLVFAGLPKKVRNALE